MSKETISIKGRLSMAPRLLSAALFAGTMIATPLSAPLADEGDDVPHYVVHKDGKVNRATYQGYRRYHGECHRCHGKDAMGYLGPELITPLKTMSYEDFMDVVINGRTSNMADTGNVMPAFGTDPNMAPYLDNIYMYLKARSDGVLPPGRPERFDAPKLD